MTPLEDLLGRVKTAVGVQDPERVALAARVAFDYALLQSQAMAGTIRPQELERELGIVEASARNLDEATRRAVSAEVMAWTQGLLAKALGVAISAG